MIERKVLLNCAKGYNFPRYVARSKLCCSCQFFLLRWLCQPPLTPDQRRSEQWASVIMSSDWTENRINKPILGDASRMVETHISVLFTFQQTGFCYLCIKHAENWTTTFFFCRNIPNSNTHDQIQSGTLTSCHLVNNEPLSLSSLTKDNWLWSIRWYIYDKIHNWIDIIVLQVQQLK